MKKITQYSTINTQFLIKRRVSLLRILFVLLTTHYSLLVYSQDIHFSQFFETPLLRNPSLAGIFKGDIRAQAVYRDQWNSVTNAYRTGSLNAELKCQSARQMIL
jgi:Type IX secretion system membrane protein PorP/SprF